MPDTSPRLSLPYIQPSQAQKHVTHNEAIKALDAITQLAVLSAGLTVAPSDPAAGDCHLVGSGATGIWAGRAGQIAVHDGSGWSYVAPQQGWRADVAPDGRALRFDGTAWVDAQTLQNIDHLGVATSADSVNRLAVASEASLFTHQGGGHQLKLNKLAAGDTASLLFQTNWGGRAEIGTVGNDDFSFKVSGDGSTFHSALELESATGAVRMPAGQSYFLDIEIGNDSVYSFDIPWSNPSRLLIWMGVDLPGNCWLFAVTGVLSGAANMTTLVSQPAGSLHFQSGGLSGATGPTGGVTVAIDTTGTTPRMHIENRLGAARQFTLATLGR